MKNKIIYIILASASVFSAQAQQEAQRITQVAGENAQAAKEAILAQAILDVARLKETAASDLNADLDKAISQLRQKVVAKALQKVEGQLKGGISEDAQQRLIASSIAQLGGEI